MEAREIRGIQIFEKGGITEGMKGYIVPAQGGSGTYNVKWVGGGYTCDCPDCQTRNVKCKHQWAVEYYITKKKDADGSTTITETKKITYSQDWKAYTTAQTSEITLFDELLKDLVGNVPEEEQKRGDRKSVV